MAKVGEIEIMTHNGRPVSEGGLRTGYRLLRRDGTVWTYWLNPWMAARAAQEARCQAAAHQDEERKQSLPDWNDLPRADYSDGWCRLHGGYSQEVRLETRQGPKTAFRCPSCGILKRPY